MKVNSNVTSMTDNKSERPSINASNVHQSVIDDSIITQNISTEW
jgi:hypothetical protein